MLTYIYLMWPLELPLSLYLRRHTSRKLELKFRGNVTAGCNEHNELPLLWREIHGFTPIQADGVCTIQYCCYCAYSYPTYAAANAIARKDTRSPDFMEMF